MLRLKMRMQVRRVIALITCTKPHGHSRGCTRQYIAAAGIGKDAVGYSGIDGDYGAVRYFRTVRAHPLGRPVRVPRRFASAASGPGRLLKGDARVADVVVAPGAPEHPHGNRTGERERGQQTERLDV
jgi:hypothetical protein